MDNRPLKYGPKPQRQKNKKQNGRVNKKKGGECGVEILECSKRMPECSISGGKKKKKKKREREEDKNENL